MSFFKNLKNAFGFSDDPISNDIDGGLNYDEAEKREPYINPFRQHLCHRRPPSLWS